MTLDNHLTSWIRFQLQYDVLSPVLLISDAKEFIYFVKSEGNKHWLLHPF